MSELGDAFQKQIGARLAAISWRPITCDTPGVVADLRLPVLQFSGAVSLFFDTGAQVPLTWKNERECFLTLAGANEWGAFALDVVHWSPESPWGDLVNATLYGVELFRDSLGSENVVAARLQFQSQRGMLHLWVGVGGDGQMRESDDLLILLEQDPTNRMELAEVETIGGG